MRGPETCQENCTRELPTTHRTRWWRLVCLVPLIAILGVTKPSANIGVVMDKAKANYIAAVEKARRDFASALDLAIAETTKTGDLDGAIAARTERDNFLEEHSITINGALPAVRVEDGWSIVFRSADPLLWNVPVLNPDSYAVSLSKVPQDARYVRLRRMDTRQFVVLERTADDLARFRSTAHFPGEGRSELIGRVACWASSMPASGRQHQCFWT